MTPNELDAYLKRQGTMSARIAQKAARAKTIAIAVAQNTAGGRSLGTRVIAALDRPGVAPSQRPKSSSGKQSFHFSLTTVNRTSDFVNKLKGAKKGASAAHGAYIERPGAAEQLGEEFARTNAEMRRDVWDALGGQAYIERPEAAEEVDGLRIASFGNIAEKFDDRLAFWEAMEAAAAKPATSAINTQRGNDLAFWEQVDADPEAPEILRSAPAFRPLPVKTGDPVADAKANMPLAIERSRYTDAQATAVLDYVQKHRSHTAAARVSPAVVLDPGRGGRIQSRIIVELPHELTPAARLQLAQDYCHKKFVEGRETPLLHWCVIHAPDHHNDPRNVHMHIVFSERPAARMIHPETGRPCWDFEIQTKTKGSNRVTRLTRPFEQKTDRSVNSSRWVGQARKDYATMANAALKAAGKDKVYDAATYKEMGITERPRERVNPKDYLKEKAGESTAGAEAAIASQWEREEQRLSHRFNKFGAPKRKLDAFDVELARYPHAPNSVHTHLLVHKHEYAVSTAFIQVMKAEKAANSFVLTKIQSKLMPPLQREDEHALLAQDFVRVFRRDIVETHDAAVQTQKRNQARALKALAAAQGADPSEVKNADFLTGRNVAEQFAIPFSGIEFPVGSSPIEMLNNWRDAKIEEVRDAREMRAAHAEQMEARHGTVVLRPVPTTSTKVEHDGKTTSRSASPTPAKNSRESQGTTAAPAVEMPISPSGTTAPEALVPRTQAQKNAYAGSLNSLGARTITPDRIGPIEPAPACAKVYGDEVLIPFFSETGEPIQQRVYSARRIRTADEQAAAVEATIRKRKADRQKKLDDEVAAMRSPVTPETNRQAKSEVQTPQAKVADPVAADGAVPRQDGGAKSVETATKIDTPPSDNLKTSKESIQVHKLQSTAGNDHLAVHRTKLPSKAPSWTDPTPKIGTERDETKHTTPPGKPLYSNASPSIEQPKSSAPPKTGTSGIIPTGPTTPTNEPAISEKKPDTVPNKRRVPTAEKLRKRALMAAKSKGRTR